MANVRMLAYWFVLQPAARASEISGLLQPAIRVLVRSDHGSCQNEGRS